MTINTIKESQQVKTELENVLKDFYTRYKETHSKLRQKHIRQLKMCRLNQQPSDDLFIQQILRVPVIKEPPDEVHTITETTSMRPLRAFQSKR